MMPDSTPLAPAAPIPAGTMVAIFVPDNHPLLLLKQKLDWVAIREVLSKHWRRAGKNVDGGPGRPWPVDLYMSVLVFKVLWSLHSRRVETDLRENAAARLFIGVEAQTDPQVRDHANIARAEATLGEEGWREFNQVVLRQAVAEGYAKPEILSSDTTAQEPLIGHPHEAGILRGLAQRVYRSVVKIQETVKEKLVPGLEQTREAAKEIFRKVKEYHLFTKGKEAKRRVIRELVEGTGRLLTSSQEIIRELSASSARKAKAGVKTLTEMVEVGRTLLPQILYWLEEQKVAAGKILHAGLTEARAVVRNKVGKKVEFGFKWLINRLEGGYVFGNVVAANADEYQMPIKALESYRESLGEKQTPEMVIYDRGGDAAETIRKLEEAGVKKVGIMPKGTKEWSVAAEDQAEVRSQRGKTEGVIGTLKSVKCGFNQRRERSNGAVRAAGHRAIACLNLSRFLKDIIGQAKEPKAAEA